MNFVKEHDFVLDVFFFVVKPASLAVVDSLQGASFVTQISEKDTDHRNASV